MVMKITGCKKKLRSVYDIWTTVPRLLLLLVVVLRIVNADDV